MSPLDEDLQDTGAALPSHSPGKRLAVGGLAPHSLLPRHPQSFVYRNQEKMNEANLSFYIPFFLFCFLVLFFCFSTPHTLRSRIEYATVVNFLLCRGAIDGALPHTAARRLQSMRLLHFLCMCMCLFATGA